MRLLNGSLFIYSKQAEALQAKLDRLEQSRGELEAEASILRDQVGAAKIQIETAASKIQDLSRGTEDRTNHLDNLAALLADKDAELAEKRAECADARYASYIALRCPRRGREAGGKDVRSSVHDIAASIAHLSCLPSMLSKWSTCLSRHTNINLVWQTCQLHSHKKEITQRPAYVAGPRHMIQHLALVALERLM